MKGILLIAEDAEITKSFTAMLAPVYTVYKATTPQEGFHVLKTNLNNIAAVLVELNLAHRNNFVYSDQMQTFSSFSTIPMIAISDAMPTSGDMDCLDHGYFDLIASTMPQALVYKRISNAMSAKDSLLLTELERMLKELPSCIFLKDSEGKYVFSTQYWNHLDTKGDPNWTIRGKTDLEIRKDKENARKAMEADRRILETGKGTEYVIEENQDGVREYLQLIKRPVYDVNGNVNGIIALINNVTDYQLLKQELEKQAKTDSSMVTAMAADYRSLYYADLDKNECLCVRATTQPDGKMWKGNVFPFFETFAEYARDYIVDSNREAFLRFINPDNIRTELANETMISHRYLSTRSGEEKYEMLRIAGVRRIEERKDHMVHAIGVGFSDVDRETREAMEKNRALTEALTRAEEASEAKTAFLSSMSHEIRTPMNAIIGLDKIALRDPSLSKATREELEKIGSSARHLLSLINDILDMSRIESGRMELKQEAFSFQDFLTQVSIIIHGQCDDKGLCFICNKSDLADEYYIGDELRLKQVLINILGNAVKFTTPPGSVTFQTEHEDDDGDICTLKFTIKDTGIGMDKAFLPKLFDAFSQEDATTTNRYGGSGLGMALTKNMVNLMGGRIEVESEKGRGTTFTVYIPLRKADRAQIAPDVERLGGDFSLSGLHILIVEDMEMNAEILTDLLELEDASIEWAKNGQIAVDLFNQNEAGHFDAILMDMRMPVMDGPAAARAIRQLDRPDAATIPIIALTANAFEEDVKTCLQAGMNAHLSKPVDLDQLKEALGRVLAP
ncbi:MAG: ATP-binding protein [Lachnospiraceae bacterium]|nr:ATP-binding protein [Lachnospiraceae bacterium]